MSPAKPNDIAPGDLPSGLSNPARRALAAAAITRLEQFTRISEAELLKLHGLGPKGVRIIREELSKYGLAFANPDESLRLSEEANQHIQRRAPK